MSVGRTLTDIVARAEEARGKAVLDGFANPDPHEYDLPIRHDETGQIMAYVPAALADGLMPIVRNGFVVGYYRDDADCSVHPVIFDGVARWLAKSARGDRWVPMFHKGGGCFGNALIASCRRGA